MNEHTSPDLATPMPALDPARVVTVAHVAPESGTVYAPAALLAMWQADLNRYYGGLASYMADDAAPLTVQGAYDAWLSTEVGAGALLPLTLAQWTDSSGSYTVTVDPSYSTLTTAYGDGTAPTVQHLAPTALDPEQIDFQWVGDFGHSGEFMGIEFVCLSGHVFEVTA